MEEDLKEEGLKGEETDQNDTSDLEETRTDRGTGVFPKCNGNSVISMNSMNLSKSMKHELRSV